jgi:hypothetical protein
MPSVVMQISYLRLYLCPFLLVIAAPPEICMPRPEITYSQITNSSLNALLVYTPELQVVGEEVDGSLII